MCIGTCNLLYSLFISMDYFWVIQTNNVYQAIPQKALKVMNYPDWNWCIAFVVFEVISELLVLFFDTTKVINE